VFALRRNLQDRTGTASDDSAGRERGAAYRERVPVSVHRGRGDVVWKMAVVSKLEADVAANQRQHRQQRSGMVGRL